MLLWPLCKKLPVWALAATGCALAVAGFLLNGITVSHDWLMPLGITSPIFTSSDYFPLLPHLGFFLIGACFGKTIYRKKQTLLPRIDPQFWLLRFLQLCGKQSLWIYLLHQPALSVIFWLILAIR